MPAVAALVLFLRELVAARQTLEGRIAHENLRAAVRLERRSSAFDVAVGDVHDGVLDQYTHPGAYDPAVRDVELASVTSNDGVAIDIESASVEVHQTPPFADDRVGRRGRATRAGTR